MSVQINGREYLYSYSGFLKIIELVLDIATLVAAATCPADKYTCYINIVTSYALFTTITFIFLHVMAWSTKLILPWHWIEYINSLIVVIFIMISSGFALSELLKPFIVTAVIGFITAMVYALDMIESWKLANTPRAQYVWTIPNMPL